MPKKKIMPAIPETAPIGMTDVHYRPDCVNKEAVAQVVGQLYADYVSAMKFVVGYPLFEMKDEKEKESREAQMKTVMGNMRYIEKQLAFFMPLISE